VEKIALAIMQREKKFHFTFSRTRLLEKIRWLIPSHIEILGN